MSRQRTETVRFPFFTGQISLIPAPACLPALPAGHAPGPSSHASQSALLMPRPRPLHGSLFAGLMRQRHRAIACSHARPAKTSHRHACLTLLSRDGCPHIVHHPGHGNHLDLGSVFRGNMACCSRVAANIRCLGVVLEGGYLDQIGEIFVKSGTHEFVSRCITRVGAGTALAGFLPSTIPDASGNAVGHHGM